MLVCQYMTAIIPKSERHALIDLYHSTNGKEWTVKWNLNRSVKTWYGVEVENGNVIALNLMDNNLSGQLPESICELEKLRVLDFAFNRIEGSIPHTLSRMTDLIEIRLGKNNLTGKIPESIVNLNQLKVLDFFDNELSGTLPANIDRLEKIEVISISKNNLIGCLPSGLGELKNLKRLELGINNIEGYIPEKLSNLKNLKTLVFAENKFEGKFPASIFNLPRLRVVQIQRNNFDEFHLRNNVPLESSIALLDYDYEDNFSRGDFKDIYSNDEIRMVNTKFSDDN